MLKIKDWEIHFETAKTKTFNRCQRLTFSNDLNDPHFRRLVRDHKDGYAHFGIWVAICEFHSSQSKPRLGYLTDDGQESGTPLSTSELADLIRAPKKMVEIALERLSDPYIGWITDERRPCDDQKETAVGVQSSPLISPLHSTPLQTTNKSIVATNVPTTYVELARRFLEQQRENHPKESAWKNFEARLSEGAKNLHLFHTQNNWTEQEILELLEWIPDHHFWGKEIRTLGGIRARAKGKGTPMKFENARAGMEAPPPHESAIDKYEREMGAK